MDVYFETIQIAQPLLEWEVCGDCRRVWVLCEESGEEELLEQCPYEDCEASPRYDGVDWEHLAHAHPDSLPHAPEPGVTYRW